MLIFPQFIYKFNVILIKIPVDFGVKIYKNQNLDSKIRWQCKKPRIAKAMLKNKAEQSHDQITRPIAGFVQTIDTEPNGTEQRVFFGCIDADAGRAGVDGRYGGL